MKPSAHLHLIVRAAIENPPGPNDTELVDDVMRGLIAHVRMRQLSEPNTLWCDEEGNEGITSICLLTTSHTVMHIWNLPEPQKSIFEFDLYSCSSFTVEEVLDFLNSKFKLSDISWKFLDRETNLTIIDQSKE